MWIFKYLWINTESAIISSLLGKNMLEIINTMVIIMSMQLNADAILAECEGFRNQKSTKNNIKWMDKNSW